MDDYLKPAGKYARIFIGRSMEAPVVFKRGKKYYSIASDCTGWQPNAARSAVADNIFGPWTELGNPCRGNGAEQTSRRRVLLCCRCRAGRTHSYSLPTDGKNGIYPPRVTSGCP